MDFFYDWDFEAEDSWQRSNAEWLMGMYKKADEVFHERYNKREAFREFEKMLRELEGKRKSLKSDNVYLLRLAYLAEGNVYLRRGQYEEERFQDSQEDFRKAVNFLSQALPVISKEEEDRLSLLVRIDLGRYFRTMGRSHGERRYFERALSEFKTVCKEIRNVCRKNDGLKGWQIHLWMTATMNIGRVYKYQYRLTDAKECFEKAANLLMPVYLESAEEEERHRDPNIYHYENPIELRKWWQEQELIRRVDDYNAINWKSDEAGEESSTFWEYLKKGMKQWQERDSFSGHYLRQALIQMGIVYQKERKYRYAHQLSEIVLRYLDPENVDAANNLAVCRRKCVELRKTAEPKMRPKEGQTPDYFHMDYEDVFGYLKERNNRFAELNYYKCCFRTPEKREEAIRGLESRLKENPHDLQVKFLLGKFYQRSRKPEDREKGQKIFWQVYNESPYIRKGTIGLKAYYSMTEGLLEKRAFRQALGQLEKILRECEQGEEISKTESSGGNGNGESEGSFQYKAAVDFPAEMESGWCLQNLGRYEEAISRYQTILRRWEYEKEHFKMQPDYYDWVRVMNNLGGCYLSMERIETGDMDNGRENKGENYINKALECFKEILDKNATDDLARRYQAYGYLLLSEKYKKNTLNKAKEMFDILAVEAGKDDIIYACSGRVKVTMKLLEKKKWKDEKLVKDMKRMLQYASGVYSTRACAHFAEFVMKCSKLTGSEEERESLYKALSGIRMGEGEEGYQAFQNFFQNDEVSKLTAVPLGRVLVWLYQLYGEILDLKELCLYRYPGKGKYPVHYTSLDTLRKLLNAPDGGTPYLRLSNTMYMNDSMEGECFIDLLRQYGGKDAKKWFSNYFPRRNESEKAKSTETEKKQAKEIPPVNECTYVVSFSTRRDAIHMWIPYAKGAEGCMIEFADGFFDTYDERDIVTDVSSYSDTDYPLYNIQYLQKAQDNNIGNALPNGQTTIKYDLTKNEKNEKIEKCVQNIMEQLGSLEKEIASDDEQMKTVRDTVRLFVTRCLNEVRFLFKDAEYEYENEVRMQHFSNDPMLEYGCAIPKLYVNVERDIQIEEVTLGSKVSESDAKELAAWLYKTGKVKHVTKSMRHYR